MKLNELQHDHEAVIGIINKMQCAQNLFEQIVEDEEPEDGADDAEDHSSDSEADEQDPEPQLLFESIQVKQSILDDETNKIMLEAALAP